MIVALLGYLYQFARGDDYCQNPDHRYIMQLTSEIRSFNYPSFKVGLSSFGNLEDKLNTAGTKKVKKMQIFKFGNHTQIFEWNANIHISNIC